MTQVLNVTSGSSIYTMAKSCWVQANLSINWPGCQVMIMINNIVVVGFQHVSLQSYHSFYCRNGDVLTYSVLGTGFSQAYIQ